MGSGKLSFDFPPSLRVTWTIPDFFKLATESGYSLRSPYFPFADGRYCLRFFQTRDFDDDDPIGIQLLSLIDTDPGRAVLYEVRLKSGKDEFDMDSCIYDDKVVFHFLRYNLEDRSDLFVSDSTLTFLCSLRLRKWSGAGIPESDGGETRVIPEYRMSGELCFQSLPSLYVTWRIPRIFQPSRKSRYTLESPEFPFSDRRYCLRLSLSGGYNTVVYIHLVNLTDAVPGRCVSHEVGLKSTTGEEIDIDRCCTSTTRKFNILRCELDEKETECFYDGHLTVFCCMGSRESSIAGSPKSGGEVRTPGSKAATHPKSGGAEASIEDEDKKGLPGIAKLCSDLRQLLQKVPDSDACLVVGGKEFRAHQNILRARSPVFGAMFGHETAERESGRVVIDDLNPDSFGDFLEYLYTGGVGAGLSDDNAFELYDAADKYDVPTLKAECVAHMRRNLSVDSFCDVLTVALRHPEEELLPQMVLFFKENMARIIVTVKWQQFLIDNGTSANELLIKAVVPPGQ